MSREEQHQEEEIEEEFLVDSPLCLQPKIFEGDWLKGVPAGFDAVTIELDGRLQADLDWKKEQTQAQQAVEKGYFLMWNMQMGLFNGLIHSLTNQSQFLSLTLALEHFRDSLWKEFRSQTLGLSFFRGSLDFSRSFSWDEHQEKNLRHWLQEMGSADLASLAFSELIRNQEGRQLVSLYCRDVTIEYIALLATRLPDTLPTYVYLDASTLPSLLSKIQMLNPERFERLHLALRGHQLPIQAIGWQHATPQGYSGFQAVDLPSMPTISIGICIPPMHFYHTHHYKGLEEGIFALQKKSLPFKLIGESSLTSEWDGLETLFYSPAGLSAQGKRKLQGFCAAGGLLVSTMHPLGFPNEICLAEWEIINLF